jgi:hypothetical protein
MRQPGMLVITKSGKLGRTYNKEMPVKGKLIVHLLDDTFQPVLGLAGQPIKLLCEPASLILKGYID